MGVYQIMIWFGTDFASSTSTFSESSPFALPSLAKGLGEQVAKALGPFLAGRRIVIFTTSTFGARAFMNNEALGLVVFAPAPLGATLAVLLEQRSIGFISDHHLI